MEKTVLILPDGREISSGAGTRDAILSCTDTQCVNSGTELTLGSVCAAMAELKILTPQGALQLEAGQELTICKEQGGVRRVLGIFIAQKPERPTAHILKLTAFDRVSLLDKDLTGWLESLTGWPYSLQEFAHMVCKACGAELANDTIPNGSYPIAKFSARGITGRKLMQWVCQAAGRFCRATREGKLELAWYERAEGICVGGSGEGIHSAYDSQTATLTLGGITADAAGDTLTLHGLTATWEAGVLTLRGENDRRFYYQGGLSAADYAVAPICKVQLQQTREDVGIVYPADGQGNTYRITGNALLTDQGEALQSIAQTLYEQLHGVTYTPCTLSLPASADIRAGHILPVTDPFGNTFSTYVMTKKQTGSQMVLESTGSPSRESVWAVNEQSYEALSGQVLELRTDVEGLRAENKAADGRTAALALTVDGLSAQSQKQTADTDAMRKELTELEQTANAVKISVQTIREQGVSKVKTQANYTFDDEGLKIARADSQMENLLDNRGMYVSRSGEVILQATADGVTATDVQVRNYLCLGSNARLEDYESGRTACFFTGG